MATIAGGSGSGGSGTGKIRVEGLVTPTGGVETTLFNVTTSNANSPLYPQEVDLSSGDNTLTAPTKAMGVVFIPPDDNTTITLGYKSASGATAKTLNKTMPFVLHFEATGSNTIIINASGSLTGCKAYWI